MAQVNPEQSLKKGGVTAAILCGGRGRRLGYIDKASISFLGQRLVDRISHRAAAVSSEVFWVEKEIGRLPSIGKNKYHRVSDHSIGGAAGGLLAALEYTQVTRKLSVPIEERWCLVLACDLPLITTQALHMLWLETQRVSHLSVCVCFSEAGITQPLCAYWRASSLNLLKKHLEEGGRLTTFIQHNGTCLPIETLHSEKTLKQEGFDGPLLFNLNTIHDLDTLLRLMKRYDHSKEVLEL